MIRKLGVFFWSVAEVLSGHYDKLLRPEIL